MECISGINTLYWHQQQLCAVKARGSVPTVFIVEMKRGLLRGNKNTQEELPTSLPLCVKFVGGTSFLRASPPLCTLSGSWGALAWRSRTFPPSSRPWSLQDTPGSPWGQESVPQGFLGESPLRRDLSPRWSEAWGPGQVVRDTEATQHVL